MKKRFLKCRIRRKVTVNIATEGQNCCGVGSSTANSRVTNEEFGSSQESLGASIKGNKP